MAKGTPTDPSLAAQWHLTGTWGLNTQVVWADYTGQGILVGVLDDGFDYLHADLRTNFRTDLDLDTLGNDADSYVSGTDKHGTAVAGLIGADDNGQGGVGVAFDAGIVGIRTGFGASTSMQDMLDGFNHVRAKNLDVMNNSWGFTSAFSDNARLEFTGVDIYQVTNAMAELSAFGRDGLGTNMVFSAGNSRTSGDNTNYHNFQNSIHSITVAAIQQNGTAASFSTKGASILVSAGGTSLTTTDVSGAGGYVSGDQTTFSGTSASAPVVSGLVALMLEANKNLGWRDVQEILVYSAKHNDAGNTGWQSNDATNWNGGGLYFSHEYGFGVADAFAAVRLAETWGQQQTSANMVTTTAFNASPSVAIPQTGTITTTINVTQNIEIEHVLVKLDIDHAKAGDLVVTLIAPDGTRSILVDHINNGNFSTSTYGISGIHFDMSSNAHWGEKSQGTWTLEVMDTVSGNAGTVNSWGLQFTGNNFSADDTYIYTDEFIKMNPGTYRQTLSDTDGGTDTLNFSAMSVNVNANLMDNNAWSVKFSDANNTLYADIDIASGTIIEKIYTGDGADTVDGNSANNSINTGRGNDSLGASAGDDVLNGGAGFDTGVLYKAITEFACRFIDAVTVEFTHLFSHAGITWGKDTFTNVERFQFESDYYTFAQLKDYFTGVVAVPPPPPPPPAPVNSTIGLNFSNGVKSYAYSSVNNGIATLTAKDMGLSTSTAQLIKLERSGDDLKINYIVSTAPAKLTVNGGDNGERITIAGIHSTLAASINAGGGDDTVTLGVAGTATFRGGDGKDTLTGNAKVDLLYGDAGDDTLNGAAGNDTIYGGGDNDTLNGDAGDDKLYGDAGNDTLNGGLGIDSIFGGAGNDVINGGAGNDILNGEDGADTFVCDIGDDKAYGGAGDDTINGGAGLDYLYGDDGNDTINGDAGIDRIYGGAGDDVINGGTENDIIYGGLGSDTINGDAGNETIFGEDGNDNIQGGAGADILNGDSGNDVIRGGTEVDKIYGGLGDDTLYGDQGADLIFGDAGNDRLYGGSEIDTLNGGAGDDLLIGGTGRDDLYGGAGNDVFVFTSLDAVDAVRDFASGDKLNISDLLTGFSGEVADLHFFIKVSGTTTKTFAVNADGVGTDFISAFSVTNISGTVQDLFNNGVLITNQSVA